MNKNKFQKGFTLIELLVVLAIIGILASILLVNFASTRNKAKDSSIKLEMSQIRTALEKFYPINNTYAGGCALTTECGKLKTDISSKGGILTTQNFSTTQYCVQYTLNTGGGSWCVDSTGYAGPNTGCATNLDCI